MAYRAKRTTRTRRTVGTARRTSRVGARSGGMRGRASQRRSGAKRSVSRAPAQKVVVELVYRDASEVARPQGVVETRKGSKPKL